MSKFDDKLIDELLKAYDPKNPDPDIILGKDGIIEVFKKRVLEKALKAEMTPSFGL